MSYILNQDSTLPSTLLKPCATCGHPRGTHQHDRQCTVKGCTCQKYTQ